MNVMLINNISNKSFLKSMVSILTETEQKKYIYIYININIYTVLKHNFNYILLLLS